MFIIIAEMESLELRFTFLTIIAKPKKQFFNIKYKQEVDTIWLKKLRHRYLKNQSVLKVSVWNKYGI